MRLYLYFVEVEYFCKYKEKDEIYLYFVEVEYFRKYKGKDEIYRKYKKSFLSRRKGNYRHLHDVKPKGSTDLID